MAVDMAATDRSSRYVQFKSVASNVSSTRCIHSLHVGRQGALRLTRVLVHDDGLASTLSADTPDLSKALDCFARFPERRQLAIGADSTTQAERSRSDADDPLQAGSSTLLYAARVDDELPRGTVVARSYVLDDSDITARSAADGTCPNSTLQFVAASVSGLELRLDVSVGGGMPADLHVFRQGVTPGFTQSSLADGSVSPLLHPAVAAGATDRTRPVLENSPTSASISGSAPGSTSASTSASTSESVSGSTPGSTPRSTGDSTGGPASARSPGSASAQRPSSIADLPDDLLAVLGPQWRPLQDKGDFWKGVLRSLGKGAQRTGRAERFVLQAVQHLARTLGESPSRYHERLQTARWRVHVRRLQPLMSLVGLLALMPLCWLLVSRGLLVMHPLTLGIAPLLMVGMLALTAREVPVIEWPRRPRPLDDGLWSVENEAQP